VPACFGEAIAIFKAAMKKSIRHEKIVPINWIDDEERWILVPSNAPHPRRKRTKEIVHVKGNCSFAAGVPKSIIDFIYRSVRKLGLTDRSLIFSRATVRSSSGLILKEVSICELDWGVGTLITIPRALRYKDMSTVHTAEGTYTVRLMELSVLSGLLRLALPGRSHRSYADMAARVIVQGWGELNETRNRSGGA
jgi:hypothetical protein